MPPAIEHVGLSADVLEAMNRAAVQSVQPEYLSNNVETVDMMESFRNGAMADILERYDFGSHIPKSAR